MRVVKNAHGEVAAEIMLQAKLVVAVSIALQSVRDAKAFQDAIESELKISGIRRVLVDVRRAQLSTQEMNESMWQWVKTSPHFELLAIVNQSTNLSVAVTMKARSLGTKKAQVFNDFKAAGSWLVAHVRDPKGKSGSSMLLDTSDFERLAK